MTLKCDSAPGGHFVHVAFVNNLKVQWLKLRLQLAFDLLLNTHRFSVLQSYADIDQINTATTSVSTNPHLNLCIDVVT
jgi:hypothetical protein